MKRLASLLLATVTLLTAWSLHAQSNESAVPFITVSDVRVRADDTFGIDPTEAVLAMCSVQTGFRAAQIDVQKAISADVKALLATPMYARVDAAIGLDDQDQWVVTYTISRRPQLASDPAIDGIDGVIRLSKAEQVIKLKRNERIDESIAAAAAGRLRAELEDRGYVNAKVTFDIRHSEAPGYAFLTLFVDAGAERSIRDYCFEGNQVFDHDTLAKTFGWKPFYNPLSWFSDYPISDAKLDDARAAMTNVYVDAGYLDATISTPELRQVEGKEAGRCDAVFTVSEGEQYTIGKITVVGAQVYPTEALETAAETALAETGSRVASAKALTAVRQAIENYYGSRGYVDTYAAQQMTPRVEGPVVDLEYRLQEGEQVRIRNIEIRGNAITQDKVIRRELVIQPGEYYDSRLIQRSEARLRNLHYFTEESGVTSFTVKTPNKGERDLVFNVREERTAEWGMGAGISTIDSVFVFAKVTQTNFDLFNPSNGFRGGGQRASAGVEIGSRRQTVDLSWTQPWLFDMPLSFTVNGYRKLRWFDHYDEIRTGAAFTFSWKPTPIATPFGELQLDRIGVRYTLEQVAYQDEDDGEWYTKDGSPFSFKDQDDGINSKLRFFWSENHRNRPFFPTSGWESLVYAEVGAGGDAKDYGFGFNFTKWWHGFSDHTVMTRLRFDTVEAYSGDVPMFDRFFLGGGRTVRGFEFRDGGPKAYRNADGTGDHVGIGGQSMWCATLEYTIPLVSALHFAVFSDIGSAGNEFCDFGDDLLWSAGCGLRLNLPGFPIRLDVAFPITNDDDTEEETFTFWIGAD
ncbi:MAG: outer membrane protein assembly factor BamA [Kiritimatiellae bacterium]|nr:outer membrane protein assembly factor BamA [Kiritimatiellia bacterium]MBR5587955.1 outer membrane protein assembly factor BamA [Kiritimatiellia bacterium]